MRSADCNFILKHYDAAIDNYDYVISKNSASADYALYQRGIILGLQNKLEEKINSMKRIAREYPHSELNDDAVYAIAETRNQQGQFENAIKAYEYIIDNFPKCSFLQKVYLNLGTAYRNLNKPDEAISSFKTVIAKYSGTDEAKEALESIRDIYIESGEGEKWLEYANSINHGNISTSQEDSVVYEAAFNRLQKGDCKVSVNDFDNYINRFPNGIFIVKANYYMADCAFNEKVYDKALKAYEFLISTGRSDYMERSYRNAAYIAFNDKDYEKSLRYYTELEKYADGKEDIIVSYIGQMRSANLLGKNNETMDACKKLLNFEKATLEQKTEAHLYSGRINLANNELSKATDDFTQVVKNSKNAMGAEAKYEIAYIQYLNKDYKGCKKTVTELDAQYASYDNWVARGYIVLGDSYVAQGDYFQARHTYQSVADNVEDEELKALANKKIAEIEGK
jgi:TolA-binding protein